MLYYLKKFGAWMSTFNARFIRVTFHMKSGSKLTVDCKNITINRAAGNDLAGWSMDGLRKAGQSFYIRIDDVSAITYRKIWI